MGRESPETCFSNSRTWELGRTQNDVFGGVGVGLGCLGFAGGLGVLVRGSAASLGDFDLGVKLTRGFHLNGQGDGCNTGRQPSVFFKGSSPFLAWKGGQNPDGRFGGRGRSMGGLRWVWVPRATFGVCREPIGGPMSV